MDIVGNYAFSYKDYHMKLHRDKLIRNKSNNMQKIPKSHSKSYSYNEVGQLNIISADIKKG